MRGFILLAFTVLVGAARAQSLPPVPDSLRVGAFSLTSDEKQCYLLLYTNWRYKTLYLSEKKSGIWTAPTPVTGMDSLYGAGVSPLGATLLFSKWNQGAFDLYRCEATDSGWTTPLPLKIQGNYPSFVGEYEVWIHQPAALTGPHDLVRLHLSPDSAWLGAPLPPEINTQGDEFTACRSPLGDYILFTRFIEGVPEQQGLMLSLALSADGNRFTPARKLPNLPYGWCPHLSADGRYLWYTDGKKLERTALAKVFKK